MTSMRRSNSLDSLLDEEASTPAAPVASLLDSLGAKPSRGMGMPRPGLQLSGGSLHALTVSRQMDASVMSAASARSKSTRSMDIMGPCVGGTTDLRNYPTGISTLARLDRASSGGNLSVMPRSANSLGSFGSRTSQPQANVSSMPRRTISSDSDDTMGSGSPPKFDVNKVLSELRKPLGGDGGCCTNQITRTHRSPARAKSTGSTASGDEPPIRKRRSKNKSLVDDSGHGGGEKGKPKKSNSSPSLRSANSDRSKKEDPMGMRSRLRRKVSERHRPSPARTAERSLSPKRSSSKNSLSGTSLDSKGSTKSDLLETNSYTMDGSSSDDEEETPKTWKCICGFELEVCMKFCGMCARPQQWTCSECDFSKNLCVFRFCGACAAPKVVPVVQRPSPQYLDKVLETSPASPFSVVDNDAL